MPVTFTQPHLYLTFGGTIGPYESWQCGVRFLTSTVEGTTDLQDLYDRTYGFLTDPAINMCQYVRLGWLKIALLDESGRYPDGFEALLYEVVPGQSGSGQTPMPPQTSLCITLETGATRGRAHRGRIYLPPVTQALGSDGRLSTTQAEQATLASSSWLDDMTDLMIAPAVVMSSLGTGTTRTITGTSVGRVLDTQRRRRRSAPEERMESLLNP